MTADDQEHRPTPTAGGDATSTVTPLIQLRHTVKSVNYAVGTYQRFLLQPIPVTRPASGVREEPVICAGCGEAVVVRVRDARAVRTRRLCWAAVTAVGLAVFIASLFPPYLATRLIGIVGGLVAAAAMSMLWDEDGVALVSRSPGHGLKFGRGMPQPAHQFGVRAAVLAVMGAALVVGGPALVLLPISAHRPASVVGIVIGVAAVAVVLGVAALRSSVTGVRAYRRGLRLPFMLRYKGD